jgi:hypothetical protein
MTTCVNAMGRPKERFDTLDEARRAFLHKWRFHGRRLPRFYHCSGCHHWHAGGGW